MTITNYQFMCKTRKANIKAQALQRADRVGVSKASADFGIPESILNSWRENVRLGNEIAFLIMAVAYQQDTGEQ